MNARARVLVQNELSFDNFTAWLCQWQTVCLVSLLCLLFASAIGVVYVKDHTRQLTSELQSLQASYSHLQVERAQLLLEEGTWLAQSRVRQIANNRLAMHSPAHVKHLILD